MSCLLQQWLCGTRATASCKCQRGGLDCGAEGANLVTQTSGTKETISLVPFEREIRALDLFFLSIQNFCWKIHNGYKCRCKGVKKKPQRLGWPCELHYICRYYDSVITNIIPHNILNIFPVLVSFKTHRELRCIRTTPACCEYACCLNSSYLINSQCARCLV